MQSLFDAPIIIILMDSPVLVWPDPWTYYPISGLSVCGAQPSPAPTVGARAIDFDEHSGQPRTRWKSTQWPQPEVFQFDFTDLSGFLERNQDPVNADRAQDDGGTWLLIKNIQFLHNSHRYFSQRSEWLSTIFLLTEDRWSRNLHVSCLSRSSGCI